MTKNQDLRLLSKVSKLYYEQGLTQSEIVQRLKRSPANISRLLQRARDLGIVRISVNAPPGVHADLEASLEERFGLVEALIVDVDENASDELVMREIGIAAARYLEDTTQNGDVIGLCWGRTLRQMVSAMQPVRLPGAHVVQVIGGLGMPESEVHATDLCRQLAGLLGCQLTLLPAPGVVATENIKQALLSDTYIQRALGMFAHLTVLFAGIGVPLPNSVMVGDGAILTESDLINLTSSGAVGDIALRYFNSSGDAISSELDRRVIGIGLEDIKQIRRVVGIAGGREKIQAIHGALSSRLINILITDQYTAQAVLAESRGSTG